MIRITTRIQTVVWKMTTIIHCLQFIGKWNSTDLLVFLPLFSHWYTFAVFHFFSFLSAYFLISFSNATINQRTMNRMKQSLIKTPKTKQLLRVFGLLRICVHRRFSCLDLEHTCYLNYWKKENHLLQLVHNYYADHRIVASMLPCAWTHVLDRAYRDKSIIA